MVLTVVVSANLVFALPKPAQAQFVVSVPNLEGMSIREWIVDELTNLLKTVLFQGLMNALNYFMQKLAYDAAVWLASGGKGQGTLFETKNWGDYMEDVALDTAGEFIGTLSEEEGWPIDLCQPTATDVTGLLGDVAEELTPQITANLQLGLADTYEPRPSCEWNQIASNWDEFLSTNTSDQILAQFTSSMRPGEDGLGSALSLFEKVSSESAKEEEAAVQSRQEGKGVKGVETKVSGNVETPSYLVGEKFKQQTIDEPAQAQQQNVSGSLSISDSVLSMGMNIGSMFLNTLTSKLFGNLMGGFFDAGELVSEKKSLWNLGASTEPEGGRIAAEKIFADLLKPTFLEITNWNPLMEYSTCPPERGANNCVLDSSFAAALTEAAAGDPISVRVAIEKGYLRKDWPLIPLIDRSRSQDPNCFTYGYCASNLAKLRKARIIPVGWEIAANLTENNPSSPVTLGEVIARFNDTTSPFYHLIDPNWVLKMPATQCKMKVNGPTLASSEGDMRESVCVDTPSCLAEGSDGKCLGAWGYCTREKNVWRINADSCPADFSSCESLTTRDKKKVSYLRNTMDYGTCNADNVGCVWYSTEKTAGSSWNGEKRIYLNKNVTECKATAAGCSDLIRKGRGVGANLIVNSSFENGTAAPDGWTSIISGSATAIYQTTGENSFHGTDVARIVRGTANSSYEQNLGILPAGTYAISAYVKKESGSATGVDLALESSTGTSLNISLADSANRSCALVGTGVRVQNMPGDTYGRISCVFNLNSSGSAKVVLNTWGGTNGIFVDAVQLEEGVSAMDYRETGYPLSAEHVAMKIPPAYLGCTGGTGDDKECANYARVCSANNVGCDLFTPTNGEPPVSAKVTGEDMCPSECSGYALFRQEPTNFERENPSVYLIPKTAKVCSSDSVGCSEFTDTTTGAVSYYSFLRRCGTTGGATYYTWEGSDTTGYQIKSWSLLPGRPSSGEAGNPPAYQGGFTDYSACSAGIFRSGTNPDCREFYDEAGNISYRLYSQTVVITPECKNLRKTLASGSTAASQQSDCAASGGTWSANGCLYSGYPVESDACGKEQSGCQAYGGNASRNIFVVYEDNFESGSITGWEQPEGITVSTESLQVGGHSLKSNDAAYIRRKFTDLHQGGIYTLSFWAKGPASGRLAIMFDTGSGVASGANTAVFSPVANPTVNLATEWRLYNLGPVYFNRAPGTKDYLAFYLIDASGRQQRLNNVYFDNITLKEVSQNIYLIKNSWITPATCDRTIQGESLPQAMVGCQEYKDTKNNLRYLKSFGSLCPEGAAGCEAFIDTKNNGVVFEEKWNAVCTAGEIITTEGGIDCVVGGQTYCHILKGGRNCYFKAEKKTIDYRCSSVVASKTNMKICYEESTYSVPEDKTIYLVNDSKMYCASEDIGCAKVGKPALTRGLDNEELEVTGVKYEDKTLKIRPSLFNAILCKKSELWCEEFKRDSGGFIYAKNPGERLCEYRENVLVDGVEQEGWFKKGTDISCSLRTFITERGETINDNEDYVIWKNADTAYKSWVGVCEKKYSGCTTLVDASDVSEDYTQGKPYYVIRNEELDEKSCNGKVSKSKGCVLFKDLNDPAVKYRADSTYLKSRDEAGGGDVTAVSCPDDEPNCKRCAFLTSTCSDFTAAAVGDGGGSGLVASCYNGFNKSCKTDSDCVGTEPPAGLALAAPSGGVYGSPQPRCVSADMEENFIGLKNDSNLIVKVTPDRECGEWLDCRSTATVWDEAGGKYKKVCTAVDLCREFQITGENESKCVKYVSGDLNNKVLSAANYKIRDITWSGMEYSGYSIPSKYQIDDLQAVSVAENDKRLVKVLGSCTGVNGSNCTVTGAGYDTSGRGKCYDKKCIRGIDNSIPQTDLDSKKTKTTLVSRTCRVYPEKTSPFPPTIAQWDKYLDEKTQGALSVKKQGFTSASVCEQSAWLDGDLDNIVDTGELISQNCECSYQKSTYGRGTLTKYFGYNQEFLPEGICFSGPRDGLQCTPGVADVCGPIDQGGTCERLTRADKYLGLEGYCVEYDYSKTINGAKDEYPCLTWRPVEIPEGGQDVYNQYQSAGYNPPSAGVGKYFCMMGKGNAITTPFPAYNPATPGSSPFLPDDSSIAGPLRTYLLKKTNSEHVKDFLNPRYSLRTDNLSVITSEDNEFKETIFRKNSTEERISWPSNKEDISAIIVNLTYRGLTSASSVFSENKGNILSRNSKHNGQFTAPDKKVYTYWETRFPDREDDGILSWETGASTKGTQRPLFIAPWLDTTAFNGDSTMSDTTLIGHGESYCDDTLSLTDEAKPGEGGSKNYFGIRAYFDDKDHFVGLWTSVCDNGHGAGGITFAVEFLLAEPCVYLAEVVSETGESAARTNDIWEKNNATPSVTIGANYLYGQINTPFGSAASGFKSPLLSKEPWFSGGDGANGSPYFTDAYFPFSAVDAGSPLACRMGAEANMGVPDRTTVATTGIPTRFGCFLGDSDTPLAFNFNYARVGLQRLFAKSYDIYSWDFSSSRTSSGYAKLTVAEGSKAPADYYQNFGGTGVMALAWDDRNAGNRVQTIAPSVSDSQKPDRGGNPFSISNKVSGAVNIDGGSKNFEANVKFYAWADKNQMPIVSRWILWGDNTAVEKYYGKYKNKKPLCDTINGTAEVKECNNMPGLTCLEDTDCPLTGSCNVTKLSFGNSPDACEKGYFEFTHTYTCRPEMVDTDLQSSDLLPVCRISGDPDGVSGTNWDRNTESAKYVSNGPCRVLNSSNSKYECVFKPTIRIIDNWGWCTGTSRAFCNIETLPGGGELPEVKFNGVIVVSP
jgi:hypothetical protein